MQKYLNVIANVVNQSSDLTNVFPDCFVPANDAKNWIASSFLLPMTYFCNMQTISVSGLHRASQ
jgi:hypothetical protein